MGLLETEAIVLRTYNLAEADKIVVCLTRNAGLVRGVARGARRTKTRFGAALEPFTLLNLMYYQKENQELVSLRQVEILKSHFDLSADPNVLAGLAYVGDLVMEFSPPHHSNEMLFRMLGACLDALTSAPEDLQLILRYFEIWILRLEGFLPDLRRCAECQRLLIETDSVFISNEPGFVCSRCVQGKREVLATGTYSRLRAAQRLNPRNFALESRDLPAKTLRELSELTHRMIGRALERRPRVQPVFQPMAS
jgi:DNA repair protein RecO (recombination protein O)